MSAFDSFLLPLHFLFLQCDGLFVFEESGFMPQMPIDVLYFICQLSHTFIHLVNCCSTSAAHYCTFSSSSLFENFFCSMDSFNVFTTVTILSSEVFCLSNATRSSFCRISSVFLTLKLSILIFLFNSVCFFSIIAQLSRRGRQFVENAQAIRFLLKSLFNFLQIITNSAGIQARINSSLTTQPRTQCINNVIRSLNSTLTKYKAHC